MRNYKAQAAGIAALLFISGASLLAAKQPTTRVARGVTPASHACPMHPGTKCPKRSGQGKCPRHNAADRKVSGKHACGTAGTHGGAVQSRKAGCPMHSAKPGTNCHQPTAQAKPSCCR